jgi:hypothetical protein
MTNQGRATTWEYAFVGPADSFQGLVEELKTKEKEGWEVAGVRSDSSHVYAIVKRPVVAPAPQDRKAA